MTFEQFSPVNSIVYSLLQSFANTLKIIQGRVIQITKNLFDQIRCACSSVVRKQNTSKNSQKYNHITTRKKLESTIKTCSTFKTIEKIDKHHPIISRIQIKA